MKGDTARDPHHNGFGEWKFDADSSKLYHRAPAGFGNWVEVKRVSFTPERIKMLAMLVGRNRPLKRSKPMSMNEKRTYNDLSEITALELSYNSADKSTIFLCIEDRHDPIQNYHCGAFSIEQAEDLGRQLLAMVEVYRNSESPKDNVGTIHGHSWDS